MKECSKEEIMAALETEESLVLYFYTPLCGTCQVAGKMLGIVEQMIPVVSFKKTDLNYAPELAEHFAIESVPCMIQLDKGEVINKIYAFQSVPFLLENIKGAL